MDEEGDSPRCSSPPPAAGLRCAVPRSSSRLLSLEAAAAAATAAAPSRPASCPASPSPAPAVGVAAADAGPGSGGGHWTDGVNLYYACSNVLCVLLYVGRALSVFSP